ncbi:pentatricopeptide repeat-containing protein [Pyrus ussuriensis x Pyrus communis]|uniref:Pentatricopeptide repeat-containing protein n=1 Tax=Pyrus ussuriensis x Pyrus communis TaxID=2448454 RepID=A0A5N5FYS9_9ROSA|nr:pentatricopeptide repeat-containing protein [Pyrus ussuriensis x Pyrus communis]
MHVQLLLILRELTSLRQSGILDWDSNDNAENGYTKARNVKKALAMLEKAEKLISSSERQDYEYLITQYAALWRKDNIRITNFLISAYTRNGLVDKAESIINSVILKGGKPDASTWYYLARGYLDQDQAEKTVESMRKALPVSGPPFRLDGDKYDVEGAREYTRLLVGVEEFLRLLEETPEIMGSKCKSTSAS